MTILILLHVCIFSLRYFKPKGPDVNKFENYDKYEIKWEYNIKLTLKWKVVCTNNRKSTNNEITDSMTRK